MESVSAVGWNRGAICREEVIMVVDWMGERQWRRYSVSIEHGMLWGRWEGRCHVAANGLNHIFYLEYNTMSYSFASCL